MANSADFILKNALEVGKDTKVTLGTINAGVTGYSLANASYDSVSFSVAAQDSSPRSLSFKPDGTKMYVVGDAGNDVNEYSLSTPWDVSTASYVQVFSVAGQDTTPYGLFFKPDGTKMYVVGTVGDDINEYNLSTAWDISTASFVQLFSVAGQDTFPIGLFFKPDGTKMYVVGDAGDDVNEYSLSTSWDISTASYLQNFSVASQDVNPQGIFFKPDGTKMYILGNTGDAVNEYGLSTAWDISTASFAQAISVTAQATVPQGIFFKPDGLKMYILDSAAQAVFQYSTATYNNEVSLSTGNYFAETLAGNTTYTFSNAGAVQAFQMEITGAALSTYLDGASYANKLKTVASEDTNPSGIFFKPDGTKMYITGGTGDDVNEYNLSTAWDVSTASYVQNFSVASQSTDPRGLSFKPDGTKMYVLLINVDRVYQYSLSTPWNISTASYDSASFSVSAQEATPDGMFIKPDGTKLYVCGPTSDRIYQYTLSTAWDISTATYDSKSFLVTGQFTNPTGIAFSSDGTAVIAQGDSSNVAYQYTLSTAWDISTATYSGKSLDYSAITTSAKDIFLGDGDLLIYLVGTINVVSGGANGSIYQFSSGESPYTITWPASVEWPFNGTAPLVPDAGETDIYTFVTDDGGTSYIGLLTADAV